MNPYLELMRPKNGVMSFFGVLIGFSLAFGTLAINVDAILGALTVFFIGSAGQVTNDYFDRDMDKKKNKKRPIPSGRVTAQNAATFAALLYGLGVVSAFFTNLASLLVAMLFVALLLLYSSELRPLKWLGNVVVSLGTMFAFIMGGLAFGRIETVFAVGLAAFFGNMAREITKDFEDLKIDKGWKVSLPHILGSNAHHFVAVYSVISILLGYYIRNFFTLAYIPFYLTSSTILLYAALLTYQKKYSEGSKYQKKAMSVLLVGFIAGLVIL